MREKEAGEEGARAHQTAFQRAWPQLRAALIAGHLLVITLAALPHVGRAALSKAARESPAARAEINVWTQRIASWGVEVAPEQLEQTSLRVLESWLELRAAVNAPFRPYVWGVGVEQPWLLFPGADRHPAFMHVEIEREGQWQPLQTMYPLATSWRAALLHHPRVHGVVYTSSSPVHRGRTLELGRWFARQAAQEFPDATRLRISIEGTRLLSAAEVRAGVVPEFVERPPKTFELADYR